MNFVLQICKFNNIYFNRFVSYGFFVDVIVELQVAQPRQQKLQRMLKDVIKSVRMEET
jgi:hypothetical protein